MTIQGKNVWFHVGTCTSLPKTGGLCSGNKQPLVSVRFDKREIHRTACRPAEEGWNETRIVPFNGEALLEFVVQAGDAFVGSANLVLHQLDVFDGALDLTCSDKPAGQLNVKAGWQHVAAVTGGDLLKKCMAKGR